MGTHKFRGENFRGWLQNCEIREYFLPWKFYPVHTVIIIDLAQPSGYLTGSPLPSATVNGGQT